MIRLTADEFVLSLIEQGRLRVDLQTSRVWVYVHTRKRWEEKQAGELRGRKRFCFKDNGKCRTIYKNRLIFIWKHRRIPEGVVDHKDLDRTNDHHSNLQEMSREESNKQGPQVMAKNVGDWFDFMAEWDDIPVPLAKLRVYPIPSS